MENAYNDTLSYSTRNVLLGNPNLLPCVSSREVHVKEQIFVPWALYHYQSRPHRMGQSGIQNHAHHK